MIDKYEQAIIDWCDELKLTLLLKYNKGKIEHGGEPVKVDCNKEIAEEVKDIINYHCIALVNQARSS